MKTKKNLVVLIALLSVAMLLTACGAKAGIEGKWKIEDPFKVAGMEGLAALGDMVYEFTKDGKVVMTVGGKSITEAVTESLKAAGMTDEQIAAASADAPELNYKVDGNKITMTTKIGDSTTEETGEFKLDGDKLILPSGSDGTTISLVRVK